jgi:hypothetical protein
MVENRGGFTKHKHRFYGAFRHLCQKVVSVVTFQLKSKRLIAKEIGVYQLLLFNACILQYCLSKPLTILSCNLNAIFPGLKMWDTFACANAKILTHFIISIAVLENVPPDAGLQKRAPFTTQGQARAGNRTRATCVASSGTNCSAIHYTNFLRIVLLFRATSRSRKPAPYRFNIG